MYVFQTNIIDQLVTVFFPEPVRACGRAGVRACGRAGSWHGTAWHSASLPLSLSLSLSRL
eukprot:SAG22_NODE_1207_length_5166_cov_4.472272_5_plen_60_part_00